MGDLNLTGNGLPYENAYTEPTVVSSYQPTIALRVPPPIYVDLGPQPLRIQCPLCHKQVVTVIEHKNTKKTHLLACCIFFLGGILCAAIPYCLKAYNIIEHNCPNCRNCLGYVEM